MSKPIYIPHDQLRSALIQAGHSAAKAEEILLDAERGDFHALSWIRVACGALVGDPPS